MTIGVGTKNSLKTEIVRQLFSRYFPDKSLQIRQYEILSHVSDTPRGFSTFLGAKHRAENILQKYAEIDIGVGIETGLIPRYRGIVFEETWCVILDREGKISIGYSSGNLIPSEKKRRIKKREKRKILEIYDKQKEKWIPYSGDLNLRMIEINNAVEIAVVHYQKIE